MLLERSRSALSTPGFRNSQGNIRRLETWCAKLVADHETVIRCLRDDLEACMDTYHDAGSNDFLLRLMETHEKMAWMLRAFLQGESV